MELSRATKISKLLDAYPFLKDYLLKKSPKFSKLANPVLRKTLFRTSSISQVAAMGGIDEKVLLTELAGLIFKKSADSVTLVNLSIPKKKSGGVTRDDKIGAVKHIIVRLREGEHLDNVRAEVRALLQDLSPAERRTVESDLIPEDLSEKEAQVFGELQLEFYRASSDIAVLPELKSGHPVRTVLDENRLAETRIAELRSELDKAGDDFSFMRARKALLDGVKDLRQIQTQYDRLEKKHFPVLKALGLSPQTWTMHGVFGNVRDLFEKTITLLEQGKRKPSLTALRELTTAAGDVLYRLEQQVLPLAYGLLSEQDWVRIRDKERTETFAWHITPGDEWTPAPPPEKKPEDLPEAPEAVAPVELETGHMLPQVLNLLLRNLPFELTFVGPDNRVVYYSHKEKRNFPRDPECIGREVGKCHQPESLPVVEEILQKFQSGERTTAEFWFWRNGRFILSRYYAIRRADNTYEGCLEVVEDITELHLLHGHGEKRLLGWG